MQMLQKTKPARAVNTQAEEQNGGEEDPAKNYIPSLLFQIEQFL